MEEGELLVVVVEEVCSTVVDHGQTHSRTRQYCIDKLEKRA